MLRCLLTVVCEPRSTAGGLSVPRHPTLIYPRQDLSYWSISERDTTMFCGWPLTSESHEELSPHDIVFTFGFIIIITLNLMWSSYPDMAPLTLLQWTGSLDFEYFLRRSKRFNRDAAHTPKCSSSVSPHSGPDLPAIPRQRSKVETKGEAGRL